MANMLQTAMADEGLLRDLTARAIQPVFRRGEAFRAFLDQRWEFVQVLARQAQR
jgi:tripartite-type tricarboxylate transporter receptor subunit TctC